jgi:hypothetical protein
MLLLRQGIHHLQLETSVPTFVHANEAQVIGDLWERYLKMLDDGMQDGYVQ